MCGFIFGLKENVSKDAVLNEILHHRGPDGFEYIYKDDYFLSHNRLSIIDVSNGTQPLISATQEEVIIYNGEIYNYQFLTKEYLSDENLVTKSDTEVILALYKKLGSKFVNLLEGIFSFVILDTDKKKIIAARDFFGIKPLCYFKDSSGIYFSSEAKGLTEAFINIDKKINLDAVKTYVSTGQIFNDKKTFFKGIYNFPSGNLKEYSYDGSILKEIKIKPIIENANAKSNLEDLLVKALELNMVSDVKASLALSSGLDSTILNELITNKLDINIAAYTYSFVNSEYDEREKLNYLGLDQGKSVPIDFKKINLIEDLKKYISIFESPLGGLGTLGLCKLFKKISDDKIKVSIGGEGADEIFGGYSYYFESDYFTEKVQAPDGTIPINNFWDKNFLTSSDTETSKINFRKKMDIDLFIKKIPKLLHFADRAGMSHGVEVRVPFLTYFLYDFTLSKDKGFFFYNGERKNALKQIADKNNMNFYRSKLDVAAPQREMLKIRNNYEIILDYIQEGALVRNKIINYQKFKEVYTQYIQSPELGNSFFVWQALNLEIFFRINEF